VTTDISTDYNLKGLAIKRDDQLAILHGGTKLRKLNYLIDAPEYMNATTWHAVGSIGSGSLVAAAKVASHLGKRLHAHCFWVPLTEGIIENLAQLSAENVHISYYSNRLTLFLCQPGLFTKTDKRAVIPPGATCAEGMLGTVRAGIELAMQIRQGDCPPPKRIYVPLGTGGIVAGLAVGLALGGVDTTLCAVAVVERCFTTRWHINNLVSTCIRLLKSKNIQSHTGVSSLPIEIKRGFVGKGYSHSTQAGRAACILGKGAGYPLEGVYSGKAFAALLKDVCVDQQNQAAQDVLFWLTNHGENLPMPAPNWQNALPEKLKRRLDTASSAGISRRHWIQGTGVLALAGIASSRLSGYSPIDNWDGTVLANWQARVLQAAIEAVAPENLSGQQLNGIIESAPGKIDAYLAGMPKWFITEVHGLFMLIEHGTLLNFRLNRFTELSLQARRDVLHGLHDYGWLMAQGYKGIRDLAFMAIYSHPDSWVDLQYDGPRLALAQANKGERVFWKKYEALRAPKEAVLK